MVSKYIARKGEVIQLRQSGQSIKSIEKITGVPRSTLWGWVRNIQLTPDQRRVLHENWLKALGIARKNAVSWHTQQKEKRIEEARQAAQSVFEKIDLQNLATLELALAMLYLGEGAKKTDSLCLGNSDPLLLRFFLDGIVRVYNIPRNGVRCALHLRVDQNAEQMKVFWSEKLQLPLEVFREVYFDSRTANSPTWESYHGVCALRYGSTQLRRRLLSLARMVSQSTQ